MSESKIRGSTLTPGIRHGIQKFDVFQLSPLMQVFAATHNWESEQLQRYISRIPSPGHRPRMIRRSVRDDDAPALLGSKFASMGMRYGNFSALDP